MAVACDSVLNITTEGHDIMADDPDTRKSESPPAAENIEIPPISKETAGAVAGAALGSVADPAGAVIGGLVGALAGKAAATGRPPVPAAKEIVQKALGKPRRAKTRRPEGRSARSRKTVIRLRSKATKKKPSRRAAAARSRKRSSSARKRAKARRKSTSLRAKRSRVRRRRH